jgi:outer membrane lipoprotein-sorting protein
VRRATVSLCVMLAMSSLCLAQRTSQATGKTPPAPTLDQILDRYETALGGREAWNKLTSRIMKGTMVFSPSGQESTVEVYQQFPNKFLNVTILPPQHRVEIGFNGEVAWSKDSAQGVRRLSGLELNMTKHLAIFDEEFHLHEAFPSMELLGTKRINGHSSYVVRTTTAEGYTATMYFDAETGLRVRVTSTTASGETYDDYIEDYCYLREVGIKYPCRRREVYPTYTISERYTEIRYNVSIDPSLFVPPSFEYKIQQ